MAKNAALVYSSSQSCAKHDIRWVGLVLWNHAHVAACLLRANEASRWARETDCSLLVS